MSHHNEHTVEGDSRRPESRPVTTHDLAEMERRLTKIMSALDDAITALTNEVTEETTVEQSALTLIQGIPALIASAVTAALAAGATPAQLKSITDLQAKLAANDSELAAAVAAGTSAAP